MPRQRSSPLARRRCRNVGHDWAPWRCGGHLDYRDCSSCHTRELRYPHMPFGKLWYVRRTPILGRLVEWHA